MITALTFHFPEAFGANLHAMRATRDRYRRENPCKYQPQAGKIGLVRKFDEAVDQ